MQKELYLCCIYVFLSFSLLLAQDRQTVQADIKHVTVFRDRAQVTTEVSSNVNAGQTQLIIEGLPARLDKQSIQVSGKGDVVIMAVKHRVNHTRPQTKSAQLIQLEDSLDHYNRQMEKFTYLKDVLSKEQLMLMSNQNIKGEQTGITVEKLKQMADFFRARLTEINEKLMENERNIRKTSVSVSRLQNQLNELNMKRNQPSSEIQVSVSAKARTPVELEVQYLVGDAGWVPLYDLRASNNKNVVQLHYKANVYQNTGVNWSNTNITLSTGNPAQGGTKPLLNPMYVDIYKPQPIYPASNARDKASRMSRKDAAGAPTPSTEMEVVEESLSESIADYTQVSETGLSVAFDIALPYTIPSGGTPQLVDIKTYDLPAAYSYVAIPKLDDDAFLTAMVTGWEKYNLLSGMANIYYGGTFVGESHLDVRNTNDTLSLSLGRDKKIIIKRDKITEFSSKKSIGSNIKETIAYRITVRNTKKEPVLLTLEDQIPVSRDSQVEVELLEAKNANFNKETGKLIWKLNLEASQTQTIELKYSVKYPKDKNITPIL